jgi:hypothetical protein
MVISVAGSEIEVPLDRDQRQTGGNGIAVASDATMPNQMCLRRFILDLLKKS